MRCMAVQCAHLCVSIAHLYCLLYSSCHMKMKIIRCWRSAPTERQTNTRKKKINLLLPHEKQINQINHIVCWIVHTIWNIVEYYFGYSHFAFYFTDDAIVYLLILVSGAIRSIHFNFVCLFHFSPLIFSHSFLLQLIYVRRIDLGTFFIISLHHSLTQVRICILCERLHELTWTISKAVKHLFSYICFFEIATLQPIHK